jgi:hypothetical protein
MCIHLLSKTFKEFSILRVALCNFRTLVSFIRILLVGQWDWMESFRLCENPQLVIKIYEIITCIYIYIYMKFV